MNLRPPRFLLALAATVAGALGAAPAAEAQEWRVSFGKETRFGRVCVDLASRKYGSYRDHRAPRIQPRYRDVHDGCCQTVGGYYETRQERVWVPGRIERVWVPARYETWVDSCGRVQKRLVCAGYYETIQHPGRYEIRERRVWIPARTVCSRRTGITAYR